MNNVLPADTFVIVNKTVLQDERRVLVSLYEPLIGAIAINLYNTLWTYLDHLEIISTEYTHNTLLNSMMISINEMVDARKKLEAVGLLKSYVKKGSVNSFVYELYSPMSAKEFINNPILNTALYNALGQSEYERRVEFFKTPTVNLKNYEDITVKFSDIFTWSSSSLRNIDIYNLKNKATRPLEIISKIDVNTILSLIPEEVLNHRSVTKDMRNYLITISFIYDYDNECMVELIRNSITDKHTIDKKLLRENANKYYQFENMGKLPSLIYKTQPEYLRSEAGGVSKRMKMIHLFETTSPYDFINSKYKTGTPSTSDLNIIAYLLLDLDLKPGVVNVLVDYVLKINNNKLNKSFVDTIAAQWKKSNIETVEDAMNIAGEEFNKRNEKKTEVTRIRKQVEVNKPSWFNQDIEENSATEEEIKILEEMLKG
jgi:replication initiation and membrane attachment protein